MKNSRTQNDFLYTKFIIRPAILFLIFTILVSLCWMPKKTYAKVIDEKYDLNVGNAIKITVIGAPKKAKWFVNKKGIVSISNGIVKAKKAGKVIVKVKKGKNIYYTFSVHVTDVTPTADNIKVSASRKGNIVKVTTENKNKCAVGYELFICFYKNGELIAECSESCSYIAYNDKDTSKFDSIDPITEESLDFDRYEIKVTNVEISDTIQEHTVEKSMFF